MNARDTLCSSESLEEKKTYIDVEEEEEEGDFMLLRSKK